MSNNPPSALDAFFRIAPYNNGTIVGADGNPLVPRKVVDFLGVASDDPTFAIDGEVVGRTLVASGGSPYAKIVAPPKIAGLTWVNQGGATAIDAPGGGFDLVSPKAENAPNRHALVRNAPETPYVWTVGLVFDPGLQADAVSLGAFLRESTSGKSLSLGYENTNFVNSKFPDNTSGADGQYATTPFGAAQICPLWLRFVYDGALLTFLWSNSGRNFAGIQNDGTGTPTTHAKNDYFANGPDQIGVYVNAVGGAAQPCALHVFHWAFS